MITEHTSRPGPDHCPPRDERPAPTGRQPRAYTAPQLRVLGSAASLLELLGPAQANYGGFGGP
jgi:hypothetical protein